MTLEIAVKSQFGKNQGFYGSQNKFLLYNDFMTLITPGQAAKILSVNTETLRTWAEQGKIASTRTKGGHRRFQEQDVLRLKLEQQKRIKGEGAFEDKYETYTKELHKKLDEPRLPVKEITEVLNQSLLMIKMTKGMDSPMTKRAEPTLNYSLPRKAQSPAQEAHLGSIFREEAEILDDLAWFLRTSPRILKNFAYQIPLLALAIRVLLAVNPLAVNSQVTTFATILGVFLGVMGFGYFGKFIVQEARKDISLTRTQNLGFGFVVFKYSMVLLVYATGIGFLID